jgi:hypothetical protein
MTGSLKLREYPADMVRLACTKCGRVVATNIRFRAFQHRSNIPITAGVEFSLPNSLPKIEP